MAEAYTAKQFLEEEKDYLFKVDYDYDKIMKVLKIMYMDQMQRNATLDAIKSCIVFGKDGKCIVKGIKRLCVPEHYILPKKFERLKKEGKIGWKPAIPNNGRWRFGE